LEVCEDVEATICREGGTKGGNQQGRRCQRVGALEVTWRDANVQRPTSS
jgi:hypothetical protein